MKPTPQQPNERWQALEILLEVVNQHTPLSHLLSNGAEFTAFTKELCFGVCRHFFRLQVLADALVPKRPKDSLVWLCILLGLYQLMVMHLPDYAVVQETVALLGRAKKPWAKGLVNAVLRRYCRQHAALAQSLAKEALFQFNHPSWFINQLQNAWPQSWEKIVAANDQHPPMYLRVNQTRTDVAEYCGRLKDLEIIAYPHPHAPHAVALQQPCAVQNLLGFANGDVSVQDAAAQLAVSLLDLKPKLRILDACCAPGGKTCHMLEAEPLLATCVALDIESRRLERVQQNLSRLGLKANLLQGDALEPASWWDGVPFDRILLDAPCSATGVIRRQPDIKLLRSLDEIIAVSQLQAQLLDQLWLLLAPGGRLVYATCSVIPIENEEQIAQFVARTSDCLVLKISSDWGHETRHGRQILPGEADMDGFFYSVLTKLS